MAIFRSGHTGCPATAQTDFVDIALAVMEERLSDVVIEWEHESSVCIVVASEGILLHERGNHTWS
jgi:phosphoribosylamine-glycine ligase